MTSVTGSIIHCAWQVLTPAPGRCLEAFRKRVEAFLDAVDPGGIGEAALNEGGSHAKWQNSTTQ